MTTIMLTVLGFLLAAGAAFMALSYGGSAFDRSYDQSSAASLISNGSSVSAAANMHMTQRGFFPATLSDVTLKGIYLPTEPTITGIGSSHAIVEERYEVSGIDHRICYEINSELGQNGDVVTAGSRPGQMGCNSTDRVFYAAF